MRSLSSTKRPPRRKDLPSVHKGRTTRSREAEPQTYLRTELLPREKARLLCAAIATSPLVVKPRVVSDHHVKGRGVPRYYVRWQRAASRPLSNAEERALTDRLERAMHQYSEMFQPEVASRPGWFWTFHAFPDSDIVTIYQTNPTTLECTCPDPAYRAEVRSVGCKHIHRKRAELGLPELTQKPLESRFPDTEEGRAALREWVRLNRDLDFA